MTDWTPQSLGSGSTLSLAGSPDGHALLATDRHVAPTGTAIGAAAALVAWTGPQAHRSRAGSATTNPWRIT